MRKFFAGISLCVLSMAFIVSCSKTDPVPQQLDCSTITNKDFAADINPIIQSTCNHQGCHDIVSVNGPGPLTNYNQVFNARAAIRTAIQSGLMPQNSSLSVAQRNAIVCWIDSGSPNN